MINFQLSEEQELLRQTARDFANNELKNDVVYRDQNKIWPTEHIKKMSELGFLGMMANPKWNGGGMDTISYAIAMEEISAVDASEPDCGSDKENAPNFFPVDNCVKYFSF